MKTLKSETAFTHVEVLMALAISGMLVTGMFQLYLFSASGALIQNETVQMQADARAAMDLIAQDLRQVYGRATISTTLTPNDTLSFTRLEDSGYSPGGNTAPRLNHPRKTWAATRFAPFSSRTRGGRRGAHARVAQTDRTRGSTTSQLSS